MLLFCDSFDHYTSSAQKYGANQSGFTFGAGLGRFSTAAHVCGGSSGTKFFTAVVAPAQTMVAGAAVLFITAIGVRVVHTMADAAGTEHLSVQVAAGNVLEIRRGRGGTILATGTTVLVPDVYYYIELKATIDDTVGAYELRINGVTEFAATNVDTRNAGTAVVSNVRWESPGNITGGLRVDDVYVCDTSGSFANDFLGDIRVQALLPNGNGDSSMMVGNDANSVDNYLLVDEAAPNSDTDYVESSTPGDKDLYNYGALAASAGTVYGVQLMPFWRKTDAGSRSMATVAKVGGVEQDGPTVVLGTTYVYSRELRTEKPGGGQWTIADVNAAQFGVKVVA